MPVKTHRIASLQDETLSPTVQNILSILLTQDGFYFTVYNKDRNKFLALEVFGLENDEQQNTDKENFTNHLLASLNAVVESSKLINAYRMEKGVLTFVPNQATWIPLSLFESGDKEQYITLNFGRPEGSVYYEINNDIEAVCVYTVYDSFVKKIGSLFPYIKLQPIQNILVKDFYHLTRNTEAEESVCCFVTTTNLYIQAYRNNRLLLENNYTYSSKQDFMYYLLNVYDKLYLNPENTPLFFSGNIIRNSEIWNTFQKYVRHIDALPASKAFEYSYLFNTIEEHGFCHLFNSISCVLSEEFGKEEE